MGYGNDDTKYLWRDKNGVVLRDGLEIDRNRNCK
jgi:hypothetical protein